MKNIGCISGLPNDHVTGARSRRTAGIVGIAVLLLTAGIAAAQTNPSVNLPAGSEGEQSGYATHHTADLGGHLVGVTGSGAMYDTLVNIHSGPRVLGQTFTMHALEGTKHPLMDDLTIFSGGFGGDPNNFARMEMSKGKVYEFSGLFRRDRQYFDYNLLDSPNVPQQSIPYGMVNGVATPQVLPYQHLQDSGMMFNTVRRMTDTNLTILPLSKVSVRIGYSHNIFQGPSTMTNRSIGKYDSLLLNYQRNGTDDITAAIDWKPFEHTKLTFEELVDHYKADSYFTLAPSDFIAQEPDGTPVALGNYDALPSSASPMPYTTAACATGSMGSAYTSATNYTIFSAPTTPGGLPVINPACDAITSYTRSQPTRSLYPTEMVRFQSTSIKNLALNGDIRYSVGNTNLGNYYENWQGFDASTSAPAGGLRTATFTGNGTAQRRVVAIDYGMTWDATKTLTFSDQVDFSNVHQPGSNLVSTGVTLQTPATTGNETINYSGTLVPGAAYTISGNGNGSTLVGYFGQKWMSNNATVSWEASSMATVSLTYRYRTHTIIRNNPLGSNEWDINENAGIFNAALRPTNHWDLNGTAEIAYNDNAFTPMTPRQLNHYRVHTMYRPKPWMTVSGAFNDVERHNNTNNTGAPSADGPLQHVDYSRIGSLGLSLAPNEHYGFDFNYSYSDVYISTNICYSSGAAATANPPVYVGTASTTSSGAPNLCPTLLTDWGPVKDFMDAPTQYASVSLAYTPNKTIHTDLGYRISAVSGSQFFNDAQEVNGSLQSAYQSPFVKVAWTVHPGWVWRAEYNYYGYGEGGPSGAAFCSTTTSATAVVFPCSTPPAGLQTGLTESSSGLTAPRNFHANNVTLSMHYEF